MDADRLKEGRFLIYCMSHDAAGNDILVGTSDSIMGCVLLAQNANPGMIFPHSTSIASDFIPVDINTHTNILDCVSGCTSPDH